MASPRPVPFQPVPPPPVLPLGARLRSPAGLGLAAAILLGLVLAADLFACFADQMEAEVAHDLLGGVDAELSRRANRADGLYGTAGIMQGVTMVATVVVYLCWLWRARLNAEVFEPYGHRMKRGWAIGSWFVPIGNLWLPRRVVLDVWTASVPPGARVRNTPVNAWWTLWIISLLAGRAAAQQYDAADTAAEVGDAARLMLFSDALDAVAAILAIVVVVHLTRMQRRRLLVPPGAAPAFG
ncbi:DUF4328 domain-containing protein [Streptomyces sp. NPDC048106]|uniref:DUF4328 domain-containing protein n=1 Tax=Streptomyces sp. NPDC048106 TaxID=3155750 RepID=UPI003454C4DA